MPNLSLKVTTPTVHLNDTVTVEVWIDTENILTDGCDCIINSTMTPLTYTPGTLYPVANYVNLKYAPNQIAFSQLTNGGQHLAVKGLLATLTYQATKLGIIPITFQFTLGSTVDTNIAASGDILSSVTNATVSVNGGVELLTAPMVLSGTAPSGQTSEAYQTLLGNSLIGKTSMIITYDLKGFKFAGKDSSIIIDQGSERYIKLENYGVDGMTGQQVVTIPLSKFIGFDITKPITGKLHSRFWQTGVWSVIINSIIVV